MSSFSRSILATLMALGLALVGKLPMAIADEPAAVTEETAPFLRPSTVCPPVVETLTQGLLRDLPSYANRVAMRSLGVAENDTGFGTVLIAGQAEFEPLPLDALTFTGEDAATTAVQQVFLTTLERRYTSTDIVYLEQYHWLFLTPAADGWRLTLMFSRTAVDESAERPPTPPEETSNGIIGQAIRLWLRDCRAGAVYPIEPATGMAPTGR